MSSRSTSARAGTLSGDVTGVEAIGVLLRLGMSFRAICLAGAHSEGALDEVLELADIAGERVGRQRRQRLGRDPPHVAMETLVEPRRKW